MKLNKFSQITVLLLMSLACVGQLLEHTLIRATLLVEMHGNFENTGGPHTEFSDRPGHAIFLRHFLIFG